MNSASCREEATTYIPRIPTSQPSATRLTTVVLPGLRLRLPTLQLATAAPQPTHTQKNTPLPPRSVVGLVRARSAPQLPGLDKEALGAVEVRLVLDVLDVDAQAAVLGEDDVVLVHLLARLRLDLAHRQVDLVADPGQAGQEDEGDDQGQ